tara:strand:- start:2032 stop:2379 length:348 start_codon:yes stop_codon:yes gene_type:complete
MNLKYWGLICVALILFIFGLKNTSLKKRIALLIAKEEKGKQQKKMQVLKEEIKPIKEEIKRARFDKDTTKKDYLLLKVQEEEIKESIVKAGEEFGKAEKEVMSLSATLDYMRNRK